MSTSESTPSSSPEKLYAPKEVAQILGVDIYTVRRWLRDEDYSLTGIKIGKGKHWRVTHTELMRVMNERIG